MSRRELVRRCLVAAASGLLATLALSAFPYQAICTGPACVIVGLLLVPLAVFGAAVVAWVLALPRGWRVALASPVVVLFAWGVVLPIAL
ncbi:hypothetical protein ABJI51_15775 [Amycolatopsis sp. NEAU-NG30]|uniref:Uncharacterized protein n=1 Tax=Amycolatopsis melonis TaxID=3156488 RepID=A0ABV0LE39_9PSEU